MCEGCARIFPRSGRCLVVLLHRWTKSNTIRHRHLVTRLINKNYCHGGCDTAACTRIYVFRVNFVRQEGFVYKIQPPDSLCVVFYEGVCMCVCATPAKPRRKKIRMEKTTLPFVSSLFCRPICPARFCANAQKSNFISAFITETMRPRV